RTLRHRAGSGTQRRNGLRDQRAFGRGSTAAAACASAAGDRLRHSHALSKERASVYAHDRGHPGCSPKNNGGYMRYFKLPDLGEGLQEAEIVEWHIKPGDEVKEDQIILSVETAKAIVDLPAPQSGKVRELFGTPGDQVHVGEPLLEYEGAVDDDKGTVVGEMQKGS